MSSGNAFWPASIATDANLFVAVNGLATALSAAIDASVTVLPVVSVAGFPPTGGVVIDTEVIFYTSISGSTLVGCTRGSDGTVAASHLLSAVVGLDVIAYHHNQLNNEIEAIETFLSNGNSGQVLTSAGGLPATWQNPTGGGGGGGTAGGISQLTGGVTATAILATAGISVSGATPAGSAAGGTVLVDLNGDGVRTITLNATGDTTPALVAADIQAKVRALTAITPGNQPAYTSFTAIYGSGVYTLTSGTVGSSSVVTVSGGTDQAALELGAGFGTETAGQAAVTVVPATVVTNANLTGNVTSIGNATTIVALPAISGAALTSLTAANISAGTAGISITGNSATATDLAGGLAGELPWQSAVNTTLFTAAGTSNQLLQSNGTSAPSWTSSPTIAGTNFSGSTTINTTGNAATATEASGLKSLTTTVVISGAAAPTVGQVLTAINGTTADWVTLAGYPSYTRTAATGNSILTVFTVPSYVIGNSSLLVFNDGVLMTLTADYTETTTTSVTFNTAPVTGASLSFVVATSSAVSSSVAIAGGAAGEVVYQTGVGASGFTAVGTTNQILQSNAAAAPTWTSAPTVSAANMTAFPTFNQSTTGTASAVAGGAAGEVLYQSGSNVTAFTAAGTSGQILTSAGTSAPTWQNQVGLSSIYAINAQTGTTYTFALADGSNNGNNPLVTFGSASPTTVIVPANASVAFPIGSQIQCIQVGAGSVTFSPAGGVTLLSASGLLTVAAEYIGIALIKIATNTWVIIGDLI